MSARFPILALAVASASLVGQTPAPAPVAVAQTRKATLVVTPTPAIAKQTALLTVSVDPSVGGTLRYEFWINKTPLNCAANSPVCEWTPEEPGEYQAFVVVRQLPGRPGGRGQPAPFNETPTSRVIVLPERSTPPDREPPPENQVPAPTISVALKSPRVEARMPATFAVSLANAPALDYEIDMGDGEWARRTDAEFFYAYEQPGPVRVVARFPDGVPSGESVLSFIVEPAPLPPIAFTLRAVPPTVTANTPVSLEIATVDGRPLTDYSLNLDDGNGPVTRSAGSISVTFEQARTYNISVAPAPGTAGTGATVLVVVNAAPLPTWVYAAGVIAALAAVVAIGRTIRHHFLTPTATFHPDPDFAPRFDPARPNVSLEVDYVANLSSLRHGPRELIRGRD